MATYRDLQDRITLDYLNRYDLKTEVKRAIGNVIKQYEAQRYWFNEAQTATVCTAGQAHFGVPSDFLALDRVELQAGSTWCKLREAGFDAVRSMNAVSATSTPTHFYYRQDRFELALTPDSAYPVNCYYLKSLPTLSADTDSNAWTNEAGNLVAHAATLEMMMSVLQVADNRRVEYHRAMLQMAQKELNLRNTVRFTTRLRSTQF